MILGMVIWHYSFAQITVKDIQTNKTIPFASYYSPDKSCGGYADENGRVNGCLHSDTLILTHIGYKQKSVVLPVIRRASNVIFLEKLSYQISEIVVSGKKLNLYEELNQLIKTLRKNKSEQILHTLTFLQSFYDNELIEKIQLLSLDNFKIGEGITPINRVFGCFFFDSQTPYLSMSIDAFFKEVQKIGFQKNGISHIFSNNKIKESTFKLKLLNDEDEERCVYYESKSFPVTGIIRYHPKNDKLLEHQFIVKKDLTNLFKPLNPKVHFSVDSIAIHSKYSKEGIIDFSSFSYYSHLTFPSSRKKELFTTGYLIPIMEKSTVSKIVIPKDIKYKSIQEELFFSPFFPMDSIWLHKKSLSKNHFFPQGTNRYLENNDTLIYEILDHFEALDSKKKVWKENSRISLDDFQFSESESDYNSLPFLSDLIRYKIYWIFNPSISLDTLSYASIPSIWSIEEARMLYNSPQEVLTLVNILFDIFEIYRKECLKQLNSTPVTTDPQEIVNQYYSRALSDVQKMIRKTDTGKNLKELLKYNQWVFERNGINNYELVWNKNYFEYAKKVNIYSNAEMLLFFDYYKQAKEIYIQRLKEAEGIKATAKTKDMIENILFNLIFIAQIENNCEEFKFYLNRLFKLNPDFIDKVPPCQSIYTPHKTKE